MSRKKNCFFHVQTFLPILLIRSFFFLWVCSFYFFWSVGDFMPTEILHPVFGISKNQYCRMGSKFMAIKTSKKITSEKYHRFPSFSISPLAWACYCTRGISQLSFLTDMANSKHQSKSFFMSEWCHFCVSFFPFFFCFSVVTNIWFFFFVSLSFFLLLLLLSKKYMILTIAIKVRILSIACNRYIAPSTFCTLIHVFVIDGTILSKGVFFQASFENVKNVYEQM